MQWPVDRRSLNTRFVGQSSGDSASVIRHPSGPPWKTRISSGPSGRVCRRGDRGGSPSPQLHHLSTHTDTELEQRRDKIGNEEIGGGVSARLRRRDESIRRAVTKTSCGRRGLLSTRSGQRRRRVVFRACPPEDGVLFGAENGSRRACCWAWSLPKLSPPCTPVLESFHRLRPPRWRVHPRPCRIPAPVSPRRCKMARTSASHIAGPMDSLVARLIRRRRHRFHCSRPWCFSSSTLWR